MTLLRSHRDFPGDSFAGSRIVATPMRNAFVELKNVLWWESFAASMKKGGRIGAILNLNSCRESLCNIIHSRPQFFEKFN
jgi:hypothetical protein